MPSVEATVIARLLIDEIISRHGASRVLLSDRGTNFLPKVVAEVCKIFQIQKVNTSSYYPKTDGLVFVVGQRVWVYTPRIRKGLSKKLMHNWLGPDRIVEKLPPVHFKWRTITNKKVAFSQIV